MQKAKILIVEDELIVALDIKSTLESLGFQVTHIATNYQEALQNASQNKPDVLLSDINLKESKNGIQIAKDIQRFGYIPVVYLTAFCDEETINEAVKTNPIGYITKPFKREDLKSNILLAYYKLQKRKESKKTLTCKALGCGFCFDMQTKLLYFEGVPIRLSIKEKELLRILIEAKGQIVTLQSLEHLIWPQAPVADSTLRTLIYRLRAKLDYKLIETIPSIGCKINILS